MLICGRGPHFLMVTFDLRSEGQPNQLTAAMATIKGAWVLRCWLLTPANDKCRTLVQEALLSTKWCQLGGKLAKLKLRCKSSCSFPEVVGSYCNRYHFWWHWMVFFLRFFSAHRFNFTICFGKGHYEVYHLAGKGAKVLEGGEPYISQDTQSGGILSNLLKMQESFPWFKRIGDKKNNRPYQKIMENLKRYFQSLWSQQRQAPHELNFAEVNFWLWKIPCKTKVNLRRDMVMMGWPFPSFPKLSASKSWEYSLQMFWIEC